MPEFNAEMTDALIYYRNVIRKHWGEEKAAWSDEELLRRAAQLLDLFEDGQAILSANDITRVAQIIDIYHESAESENAKSPDELPYEVAYRLMVGEIILFLSKNNDVLQRYLTYDGGGGAFSGMNRAQDVYEAMGGNDWIQTTLFDSNRQSFAEAVQEAVAQLRQDEE